MYTAVCLQRCENRTLMKRLWTRDKATVRTNKMSSRARRRIMVSQINNLLSSPSLRLTKSAAQMIRSISGKRSTIVEASSSSDRWIQVYLLKWLARQPIARWVDRLWHSCSLKRIDWCQLHKRVLTEDHFLTSSPCLSLVGSCAPRTALKIQNSMLVYQWTQSKTHVILASKRRNPIY